jgi:hypothetical protein
VATRDVDRERPGQQWASITDNVIQRSVGGKPWMTIRDRGSTARSSIAPSSTASRPGFRMAAENAHRSGASPCGPLQGRRKSRTQGIKVPALGYRCARAARDRSAREW